MTMSASITLVGSQKKAILISGYGQFYKKPYKTDRKLVIELTYENNDRKGRKTKKPPLFFVCQVLLAIRITKNYQPTNAYAHNISEKIACEKLTYCFMDENFEQKSKNCHK